MKRIAVALALVVSLALIAGACSAEEPAPTTNPASADSTGGPTTAAPESSTTAAPSSSSTSTTTASGESTTAAPETTSTSTTTTLALDELNVVLEEVASGFEQPVFLTAAPGDSRLFVVDQPGRIWVIDDADPAVFLDINGEVVFGGERGLLSMAFHPEFASNGLFYVNYTDVGGDTRVAEYRVSDDPNLADPGSERVLIEVGQPASNHNGGMIAFGPDGALWVGMGDGGGANDRYGQGQRGDTELGSMLRLDVDAAAPNVGFPNGNEFENDTVWAIGVRNPWRFSFDGNLLYVADVGQGNIEEVTVTDVRSTGLNFGWPILEGSACFASSDCSRDGLLLPAYEYPHSQGCSITGGYVYRGAAIPELNGHYFFSDFCGGWIRSFELVEDGIIDFTDWTPKTGNIGNAASFGVDAAGELYVISTNGGVFKLVRG